MEDRFGRKMTIICPDCGEPWTWEIGRFKYDFALCETCMEEAERMEEADANGS